MARLVGELMPDSSCGGSFAVSLTVRKSVSVCVCVRVCVHAVICTRICTVVTLQHTNCHTCRYLKLGGIGGFAFELSLHCSDCTYCWNGPFLP